MIPFTAEIAVTAEIGFVLQTSMDADKRGFLFRHGLEMKMSGFVFTFCIFPLNFCLRSFCLLHFVFYLIIVIYYTKSKPICQQKYYV